jgi:hypothetical protein
VLTRHQEGGPLLMEVWDPSTPDLNSVRSSTSWTILTCQPKCCMYGAQVERPALPGPQFELPFAGTAASTAAAVPRQPQALEHPLAEPPADGLARCHRTEGCEKLPGHQARMQPTPLPCNMAVTEHMRTAFPARFSNCCNAQGFCSNHKGFRRHEEEQGMGPLRAEPGSHAGLVQRNAQETAQDDALLVAEPDPRSDAANAKRNKAGPKRRPRLSPPSRPTLGGVRVGMHVLPPGLRRGSEQEACSPSLGAWLHQKGASVPEGRGQDAQPAKAPSPERSR